MSTSDPKPKDSSPSIEARAPRSTTSTPPGGHGLAVLAASPSAIDGLDPGAVDIPKILPALTNSDRADLLFINRNIKGWHDFDYSKTQAIPLATLTVLESNTLDMLRDYDAAHPPATIDEIIDVIQRMASLFGTNVPDRQGAELYAIALSSMPTTLLNAAMIRVATSHKYPTLPLPADLLKVVESELKIMKRERSEIAAGYSAVRRELSNRMKALAGDESLRLEAVKDPAKLAEIMAYDAETKANIGSLWSDPDKNSEADRITV